MPDRPKSTLPFDFEETAGFRESTLYIFPPEHADTARRFGRLLYHAILDGEPYFGEEDESSTRREMDAALADAVHLRDFLWYIGRQVEESELSAADARLSLLAVELSEAAGRIADALEAGLA